ncbi:RNA-directed DNA polymerase, eukaryota, partial [Tanacetum coccineum]
NFFNGVQEGDRKIAWVKWSKVLASKKFGGLGVFTLHGLNGHVLSAAFNSTWSSIITEVNSLKVKGVDLISHCKIRVGKGTCTSFWKDLWIGDNLLKLSFPRLFALEENKDISVADKMNTSISSLFCRHVRGGVESQQLDQLSLLLDTVILSNMDDRWFWDLNGDGVFQVKDVRSMLDEAFLPKMEVPTRWIKSIPIKVNVFAWKLYLDRLPTRSNLSRRNVSLPSLACPLCDHVLEDSSHLFFGCSVAKDIQKLICRWWNLDVHPYESYEDWLSWFKSIRLGSKTKEVLEGVFYVSWLNPDALSDEPYLRQLVFEPKLRLHRRLSEIQLEHEKKDEFVVVVVKVGLYDGGEGDCKYTLGGSGEKLEWWFEQDIDDEEEEDEEGDCGSEV